MVVSFDDMVRDPLDRHVWSTVQRASDERVAKAVTTSGQLQICFDVGNAYRIGSLELLREMRPHDMLVPKTVTHETETLTSLLPPDLAQDLVHQTEHLSEIWSWIRGRRPTLGLTDSVSCWAALDAWSRRVRFTTLSIDDWVVLARTIERDWNDNYTGFHLGPPPASSMLPLFRTYSFPTRRRPFSFSENLGLVSPMNRGPIGQLPCRSNSSTTLQLGKTTVVREDTRLLTERCNVCIVDTSNEIAGDGDTPHPCVGFARRMMVPSLDKQSAVMIECVQNHTPTVMVIDEIGDVVPKSKQLARARIEGYS